MSLSPTAPLNAPVPPLDREAEVLAFADRVARNVSFLGTAEFAAALEILDRLARQYEVDLTAVLREHRHPLAAIWPFQPLPLSRG